MKFCAIAKDGGPDSTVWGYWLIELKSLFSIVLLCFENGSRDVFHSHAFNSISWVLRGALYEHHFDGSLDVYLPSWRPVFTKTSTCHKVVSVGRTWVLTFRDAWVGSWVEYIPAEKRFVTLQDGRVIDETRMSNDL